MTTIPGRPRHVLLLLLTASTLVFGPDLAQAQTDPAELLKKKEVRSRLAAIFMIDEDGHPKAEKLLLNAAKDKDWEVVHRAVEALGKHGSTKSTKPLVKIAVSHPLRAVRLSAARSLESLARKDAAKQVARNLRGDRKAAVAEVLAVLRDPSSEKQFKRLLKEETSALRRAGVLGLSGATEPDLETITKSLKDPDVSVRTHAIRALALIGNSEAFNTLLDQLSAPSLMDILERRVTGDICDLLVSAGKNTENYVAQVISHFESHERPAIKARFARLLGQICRKAELETNRSAAIQSLIKSGLKDGGARVRAAALEALSIEDAAEAYDAITALTLSEKQGMVGRQAIDAAIGIKGEGAQDLLKEVLGKDLPSETRVRAAVWCGRLRLHETADALRDMLNDSDWTVMTAGAVSLGLLQDKATIAPISALLNESDDWRVRASAATGLAKIGDKSVVSVLIEAFDDRDPVVRSTIHHYLQSLTRAIVKPNQKAWEEWWKKNESTFIFSDHSRRKIVDDRYATQDDFERRPYAALQQTDVIVLSSGSDRLEALLVKMGISHRLIKKGEVGESDLHPNAVVLVNCPGEITDDDGERLEWFVHSGGFLFGACWALTNMIERVFPGVIEAHPESRNRGTVAANPTDVNSPFLDGVFSETSTPNFQLMGYQLIHTLDKARFELLIESVDGATRWGSGDLAGWFPAGYGVVFSTTNHFVLGGTRQSKFDSEIERRAYALEQLGYSYGEVRDLAQEGVFRKDSTMKERVDNLTIMRLLARFVHVRKAELF